MARYSDLSSVEMASLASRFGLEVRDFKAFDGGWSNSSFLVTGPAGKYVLTLFEECELGIVETVGAQLAQLRHQGFPATPVVRPRGGGYAALHRGKPVLMKRFVEGRVVERLSKVQLRQAGVALAQLHALSPPVGLPSVHFYESEIWRAVTEQGGDFARWLVEKREDFEKTAGEDLPAGWIHGDLFPDNMLFRRGDLRAIIDFEVACRHFLVFDLGMAIVGLACPDGRFDLERAAALIAGYEHRRPLLESERAALQVAVMWAAAGTAAWRFWKFRLMLRASQHRGRHLAMMALADEVRTLPASAMEACLASARRARSS